jgi:hypothetical protein
VHLRQAPHERQADPEAAVGAAERPVHLGEQLEDVGQLVRGDPHAVVLHTDDGLGPLPLDG